ncbi:MAG: FtsX-like permease family protein [Thermoplasmata archaeon]|nr:FtsX-like permease family protein [Thermoplasmata archaeon]
MRYALGALRRRPGRTALTALGIGLATALVVLLLAVSEGVTTSAGSLAASSGVDLLATSANTSLGSDSFPPVIHAHALPSEFANTDANVATASPWLVAETVLANASLYAATNRSPEGTSVPSTWAPTGTGTVGWIPSDNSGLETPVMTEGSGFSVAGDPHYANGTYSGPRTGEIVLDQALADVLHVGPGNLVWASPNSASGPSGLAAWFDNATAFRVVGLSGPFWLIPSALLAFTYLSELQSLLGGPAVTSDTASLVLVHLSSTGAVSHDQALLATAFPTFSVFSINDILGAVQNAISLYRTFGDLVGLIGIVVAILFATTVLVMSVDDRSSEIAILRAIGFSPRWVASQTVFEAVALSFLGLLIGLPAGYAGGVGLNRFLLGLGVGGLPSGFTFIQFDAAVVVGGILEVVAVGLIASILPTVRALRLPVVAELRAP